MRIDNSAFTSWRFCGLKYAEAYEAEVSDEMRRLWDGDAEGLEMEPLSGFVPLRTLLHSAQEGHPRGIVLGAPSPGRDFGTRFHQLVADYRRERLEVPLHNDRRWPDEAIELEAQATMAQYRAHYLGDTLQPLAVERLEHIPIPGTRHELTVKIDCVVRFDDGTIGPLDTKSERHGSKANSRDAWVGRTQAALYLWACAQLYPQERVSRMVVDVVTRGSAKFPPAFRRMDDIGQSDELIGEQLRNVVQVADEIEYYRAQNGYPTHANSVASAGGVIPFWPSNRNACVDALTGRRCDYYPLHVLGRTDANLRLYKPADDYLNE